MLTWLVGCVLLLVVLLACYAFVRCRLVAGRMSRLASSRRRAGDPGRSEFFAYCCERGLSPGSAQQVYDCLQRFIPAPDGGFPVQLGDQLFRCLEIDRDEIDTVAEDLARICRRKVQWGPDAVPITELTVRDLLDFVLGWPSIEEPHPLEHS